MSMQPYSKHRTLQSSTDFTFRDAASAVCAGISGDRDGSVDPSTLENSGAG